MDHPVDAMIANPYLLTLAYFSIACLLLIVFLAVFEWVTRYQNWEEIKKGNLAVAMATGGKIFGISNILRFAILNHDTIFQSLVWSSYGFIFLLLSYFIFEFLTPYFKIDHEIAQDNRAVGFLAMIISIAMSYVIGASVT